MTEPCGRPRRRRRPSSTYNPLWGLRRPLVALGALAIVVAIAAGLSIALGGGLPGSAGALPLGSSASITPGRSAPVAGGSALVASGSPGPSSAPISGPGIRAGRIQIAQLGIDLPIVDGDGIDAPVDKAAHYPGTGWPGGGTNIYIYAHARPGMFLPLWGATVGERVDLILVDGSKRSYVVDKVLPTVPWDAVEYLQPTPSEQLTLQTSTAPDPSAPRFVVIAHPAP